MDMESRNQSETRESALRGCAPLTISPEGIDRMLTGRDGESHGCSGINRQ
jgi:hypothetical protein